MVNDPYTLNIYPKAQEDFEGIFQYISETLCNPDAAASLIDEMESSLDLTCLNPQMCPLVKDDMIRDHFLRKLIVKNYIIFYRPDDSKREIAVIRVLYGMMNFSDIL